MCRRRYYKKGLRKKKKEKRKKALRMMELATMEEEKVLSPEKMQAEILKRPRVKKGVVSCATASTGEGREGRRKKQQYKR